MLHIITPCHLTNSDELVGLMRMCVRQLPHIEHSIVVLGSESDANWLRRMGIPVHGLLDGIDDVSQTLHHRFRNWVKKSALNYSKILGWGFYSASVASAFAEESDVYGFIDEIDETIQCGRGARLLPTTMHCSNKLKSMGFLSHSIAEPLIGVEPTTLVLHRDRVFELLGLQSDSFVCLVIGRKSNPIEVAELAIRMRTLNLEVHFILPRNYLFRTQLMRSASSHGIRHCFHELPVDLRQQDACHAAHCMWCPSIAPFEKSFCVLDIIAAACTSTPFAVSTQHPVSNASFIDQQLACIKDAIEVSGWIAKISQNKSDYIARELESSVHPVRDLTTPSRFIEGMQMRMDALV